MNEHDSERLSGLLESDGMTNVDNVGDADVVVINTCCIRENADDKFYGTLSQLKNWKTEKDDRQILVAGCLAQKDRESIRERAPYVDVVIGTHNVHRAAELLDETRYGRPVTEILEEAVLDDHTMFPSALPMRREVSYNAWVTIQIGCDNTCAYCIVPAVRGKEISRPGAEILAEVETLVRSGVTQISLIGQNVNSYGRDLSLNARAAGDITVKPKPQFAELLRKVGAVPGISRVRFVSPHPKDMREDTLLGLMHRGYTAERYLTRLTQAREMIDDLAVTTDVIVGFPGETEEDFLQTVEVCAEACFDSAFSFIFSPRPGTQAAQMTDKFIDPAVAVERYERLKIVLDHSAVIKHRERIGRIEEVVVEGMSKKNPELTTGRTRQNKILHFSSPQPLRVGTYAKVEVTDAARFHLSGRLIEVGDAPKHKLRLAVSSAS